MDKPSTLPPESIAEVESVLFDDLFDLDDIQRLQDGFANATGVASIITQTDGTPITVPSNFCRLCKEINRKTDKGWISCFNSGADMGRAPMEGPIIQTCLRGGLWGAGAGISVGGMRIANWLIGHVRNLAQTEEKMRAYAREIGADESILVEAFYEVPSMSRERFGQIAQMLFALADQLSTTAYQNVQQARYIDELKRAESEIRQNANFTQTLLNAIPTPVFYKGKDGKYIGCNRAYTELMGLSQNEIEGKTIEDLWPSELAEVYRQKDAELLRNAEHQSYDYIVQDKKGDLRPVITVKDVFRDEEGNVSGLLGALIDITERKRAEEALSASEKRYKDLVEMLPEAVFETDNDLNLKFANRRAFEMFGYSAEDLDGGINGLDLIASEDRDRAIANFGSQSIDDPTGTVEYKARKKDGTFFTILMHADPIFENSELIGLRGVVIDITERKRAEQLLYESEARFKALHNASFGGIAIHDGGAILECNQGLSEMTGYSLAELIGMDGLQLIAEESRDTVLNNIVSGYEKPYEAIGLRKNGEAFSLRIEARNIPYKGKQVRATEFRDITEHKLAEKEQEQLHAQLIQSQKMESVGRLAGGVAHDFNNMLSVIIGNVQLAIDKVGPSDPVIKNLQQIHDTAMRSADITRQLLAFARKQTIAPKVLDLNKTIEQMLRMLRRLIGEDIDLAWFPATKIRSVKMDPSQIDQILANLCVNARDAIAGVGKLTIETGMVSFDQAYCAQHKGFVPGDFIVLAVSDSGCGMDEETLDNLFDPFFTTKGIGEGTGLGLAMVYGIVKQNDGFINVYSEPGQGTTFKIYLPRHEGETSEIRPENAAEIPSGKGETILVVEDEGSLLNVLKAMLEKLGYTTLVADTPKEAMHLADEQNGRIDLLMTDVVMPEMNGRDLANQLSALYPNLKLLFMSGYTANVIAHQGVLDEGVQFIQKPFSGRDLAIKVREVLDLAK